MSPTANTRLSHGRVGLFSDLFRSDFSEEKNRLLNKSRNSRGLDPDRDLQKSRLLTKP